MHKISIGVNWQGPLDLEATIEATPCDVVLSATPIDLTRVLKVSKPMTRVRYDLAEIREGVLEGEIRMVLGL